MLSTHLKEYAAAQYCYGSETLRFVADGNYTAKQFFAFEKKGKPYILRLAKRPAGDIARVKAEMDWLWFLAEKGVSVARPLRTVAGELAVTAEENGETFVIAAYGKAEGCLYDVNNPNLWNKKVFFGWGRVMGDMHRATKDYKPENETLRRCNIQENINGSIRKFPAACKAAEALIAEIMTLPKDRDSFGMVHADLGPGNFRIDGERINVFDFDDCQYTWFAHDIGAALSFGMWGGRYNDAGYDFANDLFRQFIAGYLSANCLDGFWLSKVPLFLRLYQIALFAHLNRNVIPDDDNQKEQIHNIENSVLYAGSAVDLSMFGKACDKEHADIAESI